MKYCREFSGLLGVACLTSMLLATDAFAGASGNFVAPPSSIPRGNFHGSSSVGGVTLSAGITWTIPSAFDEASLPTAFDEASGVGSVALPPVEGSQSSSGTSVPEPGALALAMLGAMGVLTRRRLDR